MIESLGSSGKAVFTSFTKKARDEALSRIPHELKKRVKVKTLHSLAFKNLHYQRDYVLNDLTKFAAHIGETIEQETLGMPRTRLKDILGFLGTWRNKRREPTLSDLPKNIPFKLCEFIIQQYYEYKDKEAYVDYTDILTRYLEEGEPLEVDSFYVDEAQDLTKLHWMAIEKMSRNCSYLSVFGDDDQAIFAWAGSEATNLMDWPSDSTQILDYSHRLPRKIYLLSQDIIRQVTRRYMKDFRHNEHEGTIQLTGTINFDEDFKGYNTYGVLYRNHVMAEWIHDEFEKRGIVYAGIGSPFDRKDDLSAIVNWERWRSGKAISVRALRTISKFTDAKLDRYDSGVSADMIAEPCPSSLPWHEVINVSYGLVYRMVYNRGGVEALVAPPSITMSSIHHAKGGEWDKVFLLTDMSKSTHDEYLREEEQENEHRVWYVGATRAKKELQIIRPSRMRYYPLLANYPLERLCHG